MSLTNALQYSSSTTAAGSAYSAIGTGLQAYSTYEEGKIASANEKANAAMSLYNARVAEQNARMIEAKTTFDQLRALRRGQKIMGTLRAKLGASGALMSEGAPAQIVVEQAFESALENALIGYEGRVEAAREMSEAELYKMEYKTFKDRARHARRAGYIKTGQSLLSGFTRAGEEGMLKNTPFGSWWE